MQLAVVENDKLYTESKIFSFTAFYICVFSLIEWTSCPNILIRDWTNDKCLKMSDVRPLF